MVDPSSQSTEIGECRTCSTRVRLEDVEIEVAGTDAGEVASVLRSLGPLLSKSREERVKKLDLSKATIFLSYRRQDTLDIAGRICDHLVTHFGQRSVFMDIDSISPGEDFRQKIDATMTQCMSLLALIGNRWLTDDTGRRRLHEPDDFVRIELEAALRGGLIVIPVLIGKARMPGADDLPASLSEFAYRQAAILDPGRDFHHHMNGLVTDLAHVAAAPSP